VSVIFSDKAWVHLSSCAVNRNGCYWSFKNTHQLHEHSLHDIMIGV